MMSAGCNSLFTLAIVISTSVVVAGCGSTAKWTFQEKLPTMAHVHIGHAITGWKDAPNEDGLFNTAEKEAETALREAIAATQHPKDLVNIQKHTRGILHAIDPSREQQGPARGFGGNKGLEQAAGHITYAAKSDDASENVRTFAESFEARTKAVLERSDLVVALASEVLASSVATDAFVLAEEVLSLTKGVINGLDINNDGYVNLDSQEVGIKQLREELDAVIAREEPPYATVAKRYLFGVIRLPDGKWAFSWLVDPFYNDAHEGHRVRY